LLLWFINFVVIVIVGFLTFRSVSFSTFLNNFCPHPRDSYVKNVTAPSSSDEREDLSTVDSPMVDSSPFDNKPHQSHSIPLCSTTSSTTEIETNTTNANESECGATGEGEV
jgi:cytoskeletal protein RodZ